jgi:outer membrane murein-binding lipoprotein Lpp
MKRLFAAGAAAVTAVGLAAGTASAATPSVSAQLKTLNAQVKTLKTQVKTLQTQVKTLQTRERFDRSELQANYAGDTCFAAGVADLFQSTWDAIDNGSATPKFQRGSQVDDKQACQAISVTRPGITTSPTTSFFTALIGWLFG